MRSVRNNCPRLTLIEMPKQFKYYMCITNIIYNMNHNITQKTIFDYLRSNTIY